MYVENKGTGGLIMSIKTPNPEMEKWENLNYTYTFSMYHNVILMAKHVRDSAVIFYKQNVPEWNLKNTGMLVNYVW